MKFALVTGANKSIGFEVAQQLAQEGMYVYLGSRSLENGVEAVGKLKAKGLNNAEAIQLDITDDESVIKARKEIGKKTNVLYILINNGVFMVVPHKRHLIQRLTSLRQFMTQISTAQCGLRRHLLIY
ncbi:NAD(P)-dependent dehydrogenase (short-subunit alcohol dehydrogenase family) [Chitinophaga sp. W3I9]|uniref:SDR family NAD(P)-dependent oxidoreductase n=1 Tax=Chitinophaga sp. W3I9 TaxID=3373924 RepID=UPI003D217222